MRRLFTLWLVAVVAVAVCTVFSGGWSPFQRSATTIGAAAACQSDGGLGCVATLPCSTSPCPSVDVSPATDLHDGQYTFVTTSNFDNTGSMRVALCQTNSSPTDPSCLTGNWEDNTYGSIQVPISDAPTNANLTKVAFPAFYDPNVSGNVPLPAHDITNTVGAVPGFFCGDAADPCEIVVTEEAGQGNAVGFGPPVSSSNSVIIPLTFAAANAGCPATDPTIQTDSSFSLEHFIPQAVDASCGGSNGVIDLNIATDNDSVVKDFANGGSPISFIDNPSNISEIAQLAGHAYAFIPLALSGTVVSFLAGNSIGALPFPVASFKLTPNMVAGLITSAYQVPGGNLDPVPKPHITLADNLIPPLDCANLVGCPNHNKTVQVQNEQAYNAFQLLNPVASNVTPSKQYGSFLSNVPSGASYQATDWLCNAPNNPYNVSVNEITPPAGQTNPVTVSVTDPNVASTTLTTAPIGSDIWPPYNPPPPWVFPTCQPYATIPPLSGTEANFQESQSPALQSKALRGWAFNGTSLPPTNETQDPPAGFSIMDSSEASFYGLNDATLQNASGNFEDPTTTALENGAADLSPCPTDLLSCPAGTYAMNYASTSLSTDANAYPMPNVTYAVVSTAPQPPDQVTAEKNLLDSLVTFSHNSASQLPAGYAPLPDSLYQAALTDISSDLVAQPGAPSSPAVTVPGASSGGGSSGGGGTSGSTGSGDSGSGFAGNGTGPSLPSETSGSSGGGGGGNNGNSGSTTSGAASSTVPLGSVQLVLDNAARFLLPVLMAIALACLVVGPLVYFLPALRRRRRP